MVQRTLDARNACFLVLFETFLQIYVRFNLFYLRESYFVVVIIFDVRAGD